MKKVHEISFLEQVELSDVPDLIRSRFSGCEKIYSVSDIQLARHRISKGDLGDWIRRIRPDYLVVGYEVAPHACFSYYGIREDKDYALRRKALGMEEKIPDEDKAS